MKRKHVKCYGLFRSKSCNANARRSQGLMAVPGMIQNKQTPLYSVVHLSYQKFSETTQSSKFLKKKELYSQIR